MSQRSYFFPPLAAPAKDFASPEPEHKRLRSIYRQIDKLSPSWCPVCRVFVKDDEIHWNDGRPHCHKIINVALP